MANPSRRGRLPASQRDARRRQVLAAALDELVENGPGGLTMAGVARRADASKETLYAWFGNRDALIGALIEANADASVERVTQALEAAPGGPESVRDVLETYARALLALLTGDASVALNRAAMGNPALASRLLHSGRHRAGPRVERDLARLAAAGRLRVDDPADAYRVLFGLVVQDTQIRVLLGEPPPSEAQMHTRARDAVDAFLRLYG